MRSRSAVERCSTSAGDGVGCDWMAASGLTLTAARASLRRFHCCVGCRVSYGRFERGMGWPTGAVALLSRRMQVSCALPVRPVWLLGLDLLATGSAVGWWRAMALVCITAHYFRTCTPACSTHRSIE
jgi:hypothetical protein